MALITVYSILQRSRDERMWLEQTATNSGRVADALEALVAKLTEPDTQPPSEQQPAVDALVETLRASNSTLADEVAKILAVNPTPQGA